MNSQLRQLQLLELDILKFVLDVCEKNHLQCIALDGTMLGAVRHQGFIPWDDDVDIGMPRKDYDTLLEILPDLLPSHFAVSTDREKDNNVTRVVDTRYRVSVNYSVEKHYRNVWIDIFPLDGIPDKKLAFTIHKMRLFWYRTLVQFSAINILTHMHRKRPFYEKVVIKLACLLKTDKYISNTKNKDKITKLLKKYPVEESSYIWNFWSAYRFKEIFNKNDFLSTVSMKFEDLQIQIPHDYDEVLTKLYGDYMTPPPDDLKGNRHMIEFEDDLSAKNKKKDVE